MRRSSLVVPGIVALLSAPAGGEPGTPAYTIEEIRAVARSVHPTLESVEAGVEAASESVHQARAYPNPALAAAFGRGRPSSGGDARNESSFGLLQPIELPGVRKWRIRLAELGVRAAEVERAVAESIVDSTVARLAHTVLGGEQSVEIARDSLDVAARLHELLARRVELGEAPPLDAVKARSEWYARQQELLVAESELELARSTLDLFCGRRLGTSFVVTDVLDAGDPTALPDDLVERLQAGNPVLLGAELAIEQAGARIEIERKAPLPRIDVVAGHDTELDRSATHVGVGLTVPLWNRNRGAVAAATASRHRLTSDLAGLRNELEADLARAATAYRRASS
ncbi:MAG TPA: TolC family protein, partial [Candidatus Polarisedimenticolaceae bacterium]|nr:TolC family protein [Candidatus Polarisedimenticolaceae bacterium]